jgi:hypothetical protein
MLIAPVLRWTASLPHAEKGVPEQQTQHSHDSAKFHTVERDMPSVDDVTNSNIYFVFVPKPSWYIRSFMATGSTRTGVKMPLSQVAGCR